MSKKSRRSSRNRKTNRKFNSNNWRSSRKMYRNRLRK